MGDTNKRAGQRQAAGRAWQCGVLTKIDISNQMIGKDNRAETCRHAAKETLPGSTADSQRWAESKHRNNVPNVHYAVFSCSILEEQLNVVEIALHKD
jgi:hypothetical protein